jgi:dienelactone hydrolase
LKRGETPSREADSPLMMLHAATIWMLLAGASEGSAGSDLEQAVRTLRPKDVSAAGSAVLDNLEARAQLALSSIPRARDRRAADAARQALRERLDRSLGLHLLPWPPELKPRVVGTLNRPGYRVEKIVYQTLPDLLVPAHLYLPAFVKEPAPAVLFYPGHWWADSKARPDFQAFCINMARLGFVVLSFDPFGQGERGVSARDHRRTEALLVGVAQQGIAAYETRCALAYLVSRKEVDRTRIGMTGASGGGYNTWITTALDDRITAAVPVVGTSEFLEQIHVCRPLDWYHAAEHCHFVPGLIRYANNHEFLAMAAPRPLLIIAAERDESFPIDGVRGVYEYGKALYDSYGAGERIGMMEDRSEGHGYQRKKREAAYGWFLRWLMHRGDGSPCAEPPTETAAFDDAELRCFPAGGNQPAGPAIVGMVKRLARDLPPRPSRLDLAAVLGPWPQHSEPGRAARAGMAIAFEGMQASVQRVLVPSEPGITLPAFLLAPEDSAKIKGVVLALEDRGKEAVASEHVLKQALDRGWAVCGADPRGIGELAVDKAGWVFAVSLLLGENFVGRQAWDVRRVAEEVGDLPELRDKPVAIYARGPDSALAATYALAPDGPARGWQRRLRCFVLRDGFLSFHAFLERPRALAQSYRLLPADRERTTAFDREIPAMFCAFAALRHWDIPQLLTATQVRGLVVNPTSGDWDPIGEQETRPGLPERIRFVWAPEREEALTRALDDLLR